MRKNADTENRDMELEKGEKTQGKQTSEVMGKLALAGSKGAKMAGAVMVNAASGGKIVAKGVSKGARELTDKMKTDGYMRKLKKYNPLFPEDYVREDFFLPNIICIVDDAVRRDIDVCKGAIGWRDKRRDTEILYMYDEFVRDSGLTFVPTITCDEVYYVDPHDRKRFIKLDCIFQQAHDEKMAELEHIAYSLGAKKCSIEFEEVKTEYEKNRKEYKGKEGKSGITVNENYQAEAVSDNAERRYSKSETCFKGNDIVTKPLLKWFAHDNNILNLIEYRCTNGNEIMSKTLILNGSASATIGRKAAYSIDAALADAKWSQSYSMEEKSIKESKTRIVYQLEF